MKDLYGETKGGNITLPDEPSGLKRARTARYSAKKDMNSYEETPIMQRFPTFFRQGSNKIKKVLQQNNDDTLSVEGIAGNDDTKKIKQTVSK